MRCVHAGVPGPLRNPVGASRRTGPLGLGAIGRRALAGGVAVVVALALMVTSPAAALAGATTEVAAAPPAPSYVGLTPARVLDTRPGTTTVDGQAQRTGPLAPGETRVLQIGGRGGVPATATAAVLNLTATAPTTPGFLTVFPTGAPRPQASNLNFDTGRTIANLVIAKLNANGQVSIYNNSGSTQVIADVSGAFPGSAGTTTGFHVGVYGSPDPQYVDAALVNRIADLNTKVMRVELPAVSSGKSALQTTIDLAHRLGRTVVAEGIETVESWHRLRELGADVIQGYLLLRAAPAEAFDAWLATYEQAGAPTSVAR